MSDDHRLRCSVCRRLMPTADERSDGLATEETCLCEDKWLPGKPPPPPEPPKPVKG